MTDVRYPLLDEPLLSVADAAGRRGEPLSLPALYAALVRDAVGDFPALRPHQRHVWHAFLVQVAALALHRAGLREMPDDADTWRALLLALTPDDPDGAAWALVAPPERPALLQAPAFGGLGGFKGGVDTPDALDMLVTAKNHDVKQEALVVARPEHWLYALVSLQTQEGFLGAGNYGISRMNGGFASRPGFGVAVAGSPGARVRRDVRRLWTLRDQVIETHAFYPSGGGVALLWLVPWDGVTSLRMDQLDPFYVEICRRIRLTDDRNGVRALVAGSKAARIDAKALTGNTGDPWTPLIADGDSRKAFTADAGGLTYKRLVPLLFPAASDPKAPIRAPLQGVDPGDPDEGLSVVARAIVRGQGKTEGLHERRIPVSKTTRRFFAQSMASDEASHVASGRVEDAGTFARRVLYPALLSVYTAAPSANERTRDDDTAKNRVRRALDQFDGAVDATFFADLDAELQHSGDEAAQQAVRATWLLALRDRARTVLAQTLAAAPSAAMRHYRTRVRSTRRFESAFARQFGERIASALPTYSEDRRDRHDASV